MQVVYHLGAHSTDEERLIRTLAENRATLAQARVAVPGANQYRPVLRETLMKLKGGPADAETQARILQACGADDLPRRLVFSHEFFLCVPGRVVTDAGFYTMVPAKLGPLVNLFPDAQSEFHMALINPATLLPALKARLPKMSYDEMMSGRDPRDLRWAPVVRAMVEAAGGSRVVLWCNEDLPMLWPEILRSLAGLPASAQLVGDDALLATIMSEEGLARLRSYLRSHPPQSATQRRKIVSAFLDKFVLPDAVEVEIPLPGWTDDLVAEITAAYDADVAEIAAMPGVEFLAP
ncbi:MAG: hypothetical protein PHX82_14010 [Paracoccaceae bacterium]|jgi:hypothetical protein|nr:hypothetical protein [Paracoccaceae bacterium]